MLSCDNCAEAILGDEVLSSHWPPLLASNGRRQCVTLISHAVSNAKYPPGGS